MSLLLLLGGDAVAPVEPSVDITIAVDGALQLTTDHAATARSRFLEQYKSAARLGAMSDAYQAQLQQVEEACWQVLLCRDLSTAFGSQLDDLGSEAGVVRGSLGDDDFVQLVRAKILSNYSNGRPGNLIGVLKALLGDSFDVTYQEIFPASHHVRLNDEMTVHGPAILFWLLQKTRAAGTRMLMTYLEQDGADSFTLASGAAAETSASQGFADLGQTTGGNLAGAYGD